MIFTIDIPILSIIMKSLQLNVFKTPEILGASLAEKILQGILVANRHNRPYLLGCPSGRSLRSTYKALGKLAAETHADLSKLVIVMMDDYVVSRGNSFVNCPIKAHFSCRRFSHKEIYRVINRKIKPSFQIKTRNIWNPDPKNPAEYDLRIKNAGGIDCFLLASGASDGHVAFNPPQSTLKQYTRIIPLAESTRRDNLKTFPKFTNLAEVPRFGVSVGLGTIADFSKNVVMVIHGKHKQAAVSKLLSLKKNKPAWPASIIYQCKNAALFVDAPAYQ